MLERETLNAVTGKVQELAGRTGEDTPPPPVLGYRGFRIEDLGPDAPDAVFVGRGTVTLIRGKRAEHTRDTVDLEAELLEDASNRGFTELLRAAGAPQVRTR
jgi:hypothetical protein